MESKKANLIIDVAKNIVMQYREQLAKCIEEIKQEDLNSFYRENSVNRAERCLECVDGILKNFELSVFDGKIDYISSYENVFYQNKYITHPVYYTEKLTKEEREIDAAKKGVVRLFQFLAIPERAIYPVVADLTSRYREKNYVESENIDEDLARVENKNFNVNGKYNVGELKYNVNLINNVDVETGALIKKTIESTPEYYCLLRKDFILDIFSIKEIVDKYIDDQIKSNQISILYAQNELIHETLDTLRFVGNNGGGNSLDGTDYYDDYFMSLFKYNSYGKDYLKNPVINNNLQTFEEQMIKELELKKRIALDRINNCKRVRIETENKIEQLFDKKLPLRSLLRELRGKKMIMRETFYMLLSLEAELIELDNKMKVFKDEPNRRKL